MLFFVLGISFITRGLTYSSESLSLRCVGEDILPNALEWTEQTTVGGGRDTRVLNKHADSQEHSPFWVFLSGRMRAVVVEGELKWVIIKHFIVKLLFTHI